MPTIPSVGEPQVAPAVPPNVKPFSPGAASYGYGLGSGLEQAGASGVRVQLNEQQRTDRSASLSAYSDALALRSTILYDEKTGLSRQRGRNYLDAAQEADKRWSKGLAEISARLTPEQAELFEERAMSLRAGFADDLKAGVSGARSDLYDDEMGKVIGQTSKDALSAVSKGAVGFTDAEGGVDDTVIQTALTEFEAPDGILDTYAPHMAEKWGVTEDEARRKMTEEYASGLHIQTTDALIARGDDLAAQAYFQAHQDAITDPNDRLRLTAQTEKGSREAMTEATASTILAEAQAPDEKGVAPTAGEQRARIKAGIEKVPLEHRKAVRDRVDELEAEEAEDLRVAQSQNFDELHKALQDGTALEDVENTPMFNKSDEGGISPDQRDALRVYKDNLVHGRYASTSPEVWARLTNLVETRPGDLLKVNLRELTSTLQLSEDDRQEVEHWQDLITKASKGDAGAADDLKLSLTRHQTMEAHATALELDETEAALFELRIKEKERRAQRSGKALTDEEFDTLVQRETVKASVNTTTFGFDSTDEKYLHELTKADWDSLESDPSQVAFEDIPPADVDEITEALLSSKPPQPTDQNTIRSFWIRSIRKLKVAGE